MSAKPNPIKTLVNEYGWVHLSIGLIGNFTFVAGSVLFLPQFEPWKTVAVWLFIIGASLMLVGSVGRFLVDMWAPNGWSGSNYDNRNRHARTAPAE